jgi:hypothetical protein
MNAAAINSKSEGPLFKFSAGMLLLTAVVKLYSSGGTARVFQAKDQLLHLGYRPLMILAALVEVVAAVFLLRSRSDLRRCLLLLWLSGNFLFYHWGGYLLGFQACPCLGHLTDRLPLPPGSAEVALQVLVLFWFLASLDVLWRVWASAQWTQLSRGGKRIVHGLSPRTHHGWTP